MQGSEEWRVMKVVVLGNGQIGKTTFVRFIKHILDPSEVSAKMNKE